jgi:hypothetical protein
MKKPSSRLENITITITLFSQNGTAIHPIVIKNVQDRMARQLMISGLNPDLTPHSLRNTPTMLLVEAGPLEKIMVGSPILMNYKKCISSHYSRNEKRSLPKVH